jgi:hypothetical protein
MLLRRVTKPYTPLPMYALARKFGHDAVADRTRGRDDGLGCQHFRYHV